MNQTKIGSFVESLINVVVGFSINFVANLLIFPLFNIHITLSDNFILGIIYTLISIVRSYTIRRWFNSEIKMFSNKITKNA